MAQFHHERKVRLTRRPDRIGDVANPTLLWNWIYEALLISENHWRVRESHFDRVLRILAKGPSFRWSGGGPFFVAKESVSHGKGMDFQGYIWGNPFNLRLQGVLPVSASATHEPDVQQKEADYLGQWLENRLTLLPEAAVGVQKTRPGNAEASLGQFLWELQDLPQIPLKGVARWAHTLGGDGVAIKGARFVTSKSSNLGQLVMDAIVRLQAFTALGDEYLNQEFGWKPFVRDLQQLFELSLGLNDALQKLIRESGKELNRRTTLKNDTTTEVITEETVPYCYFGVGGSGPSAPPWGSTKVHVSKETYEKIWFAATYKYEISDPDSWVWRARAVDALYGVTPTPEVLWNVLPWSWLLDWFSNFGAVFSNISPNAVDNLVILRSYVMRHKIVTTRARATVQHDASALAGYHEWPAVNFTFESQMTQETKARIADANPYLPAARLSVSLTERQWSILTALAHPARAVSPIRGR